MSAKDLQFILDTLHESNCPYAGEGKNKWLTEEILFKSSFERYNLMEWILEQLGINAYEGSQNENSVESKIHELTEVLSGIGVCGVDNSDIIEGTASIKKQTIFWKFLCTMLSKRSYLDNSSFESTDSNDSVAVKSILYEQSTEYISKVCESVNLIDCFDKELQLFPLHLTKEVKGFFKTSIDQEVQNRNFPDSLSNDLKLLIEKSGSPLTAEEIKQNYFDKFGTPEVDFDTSSYLDAQQKNLEFKEFVDQIIPDEVELKQLEDDIAMSLKNLENVASTSENVYNNLKPFLTNVKLEEFVDIGPAIKATDNKINHLLKFKNAATSLKALDSELKVLKSAVSGFQISSECLSDDKLGEYLEVISLSDGNKYV